MASRRSTLLVCAGDPSGDALAAAALRAWLRRDPARSAEGLGGPALAAAGLRPLAVPLLPWPFPSPTGILEPLRAVPALLAGTAALLARARRADVAAALLVDLPDVNLPHGRLLRAGGTRVIQAVAPQTWAWRAGRNRALRASCDVLAVILAFEEPYFRELGIDARFVGHPLVERLGPLDPPPAPPPDRPIRLALLPGSRPERVRDVLPPLLAGAAAAARGGGIDGLVVSRAPAVDRGFVERAIARADVGVPVEVEEREPLEWLGGADGDPIPATPGARRSPPDPADRGRASGGRDVSQVWVAAGTASLEVAATGIPACVAWRGGSVAWAVARRFVRGPYAGLPNRLLGREALPERIQDGLAPAELVAVFERLRRPESFAAAASAAREIRETLGGTGFAERLADGIDEVTG